jgi:hypothetical protein
VETACSDALRSVYTGKVKTTDLVKSLSDSLSLFHGAPSMRDVCDAASMPERVEEVVIFSNPVVSQCRCFVKPTCCEVESAASSIGHCSGRCFGCTRSARIPNLGSFRPPASHGVKAASLWNLAMCAVQSLPQGFAPQYTQVELHLSTELKLGPRAQLESESRRQGLA